MRGLAGRLRARARRVLFGPPPAPPPRTVRGTRGVTMLVDYDLLAQFAPHSEAGWGGVRPSYGVAEIAGEPAIRALAEVARKLAEAEAR